MYVPRYGPDGLLHVPVHARVHQEIENLAAAAVTGAPLALEAVHSELSQGFLERRRVLVGGDSELHLGPVDGHHLLQLLDHLQRLTAGQRGNKQPLFRVRASQRGGETTELGNVPHVGEEADAAASGLPKHTEAISQLTLKTANKNVLWRSRRPARGPSRPCRACA